MHIALQACAAKGIAEEVILIIPGVPVFVPFKSHRLSPFVLAGGGALIFSPTNTFNNSFVGAETQAQGAFLYGAGADYTLFGGVAVRAQYRGLLYKAPDFNIPGFSTGGWGHMAEPTVGLVFRF